MCKWNPGMKGTENGAEAIFKETLAENFPTLMRDIITQSQETLRTVKNDLNANRKTLHT